MRDEPTQPRLDPVPWRTWRPLSRPVLKLSGFYRLVSANIVYARYYSFQNIPNVSDYRLNRIETKAGRS